MCIYVLVKHVLLILQMYQKKTHLQYCNCTHITGYTLHTYIHTKYISRYSKCVHMHSEKYTVEYILGWNRGCFETFRDFVTFEGTPKLHNHGYWHQKAMCFLEVTKSWY